MPWNLVEPVHPLSRLLSLSNCDDRGSFSPNGLFVRTCTVSHDSGIYSLMKPIQIRGISIDHESAH